MSIVYHRFVRAGALMTVGVILASCMDSSALTDVPETPAPSPVKWVLIDPASAQVAPGKNLALSVQLQDGAGRDLSGQPVLWSSSDSTVATVDSMGTVTAKKIGSANIVAKSGQTSAYAVVSVSTAPPPTLFVSLTPSAVTVAVRATAQIFATVKDAAGNLATRTPVTWNSSNAAVATVSTSGELTGVAVGSANIVATAGSNSASVAVTVNNVTPPPPVSPPPPPPPPPPSPSSGALFSGYSATSPHWPHIRTMMTDFYYGWTPAERSWAGAHYDYAMSGSGSAWKQANASVSHLPYVLEWTTRITTETTATPTTAYYADMQTWYAAHSQYHIESAFLHVAGAATGDSASRLVLKIWDSQRWVLNPADAGARDYTLDRLARLVASEDGVFIDEYSGPDLLSAASKSAEFATSTSQYATANTSLLAAIKGEFGSKLLMLNTAQYMSAFDLANATAAGAVHLEKANNPLFSETYRIWQWIDQLEANGVLVDFVSAYSSTEAANMSGTVPPGNSSTTASRFKLWELASYYMVVPATPDHLALQLENMWNVPYSTIWLRAQEANIGHPTGSRVILSRGVDPLGQGYTLFSRDFDRALVLLRHQSGWGTQSYVDQSAITVPLPGGETWLPLNADGTLGAPVTSVRLRNVEAVILIKQSRIQ